MKLALASAPVLTLPSKEDYFILDTDASEFAIGAELSQIQNGVERTIAYASLTLLPEQRHYCTQGRNFLQLYFSPDISDTIYWEDVLQFVPIIAAYSGY